jgi:hypothetical protein
MERFRLTAEGQKEQRTQRIAKVCGPREVVRVVAQEAEVRRIVVGGGGLGLQAAKQQKKK